MSADRRVVIGLAGMALGLFLAGCKTDGIAPEPRERATPGPVTSLETPEGISLPAIEVTGRTEVDLVEEMVLHRAMYARYLRALVTFYTENGNEEKANWARWELKDFQRVKPYKYLRDAEVPVATLRPTESIAEADRLYDEGLALMKKGGHGVAIFYHQQTMKQALAKFKQVVDEYPTSDKIDDAAYQIGELHKEYFEEKDNDIAIWWYQRAIDWNPDIDHPAWSRIAHIYDYRLHERERALEWYQKVLENERDKTGPEFLANVSFAERRIGQLTKEKTRNAPGEATPDMRPEPAGSPEPDVAPGEDMRASPQPRRAPR